jgi:hypothetical protein
MPLHGPWHHRTPSLARSGGARRSRRLLSVWFVCAVAMTAVGCSTEPQYSSDPCSPNYVPWASQVVGPAGGVVEYSDPGGVLDGLKVVVPAGKWAQCWEVTVSYVWPFSTPDYPDGFVPFERPWPTGSVELAIFRQTSDGEKIYAPDSMYVEVSFPLKGLPADSQNFVSAFYHDSTANDWRVRLPDNVSSDYLAVRTRAWKHPWSFGRIDFADIDFDRYIVPGLEERLGTETWSRIHQTVDSLYRAAMQNTWDGVSCAALDIAEAVFASFRDRAATLVDSIQATLGCGDCNATTGAFYDDLRTYVRLKLSYMIAEMLSDETPGSAWVLKIAGLVAMGALQAEMDNLPCDYECLADAAPLEYYVGTAMYGGSALVVYAIQWYRASGFISCPGTAAGGLTLGGAPWGRGAGGVAPTRLCAALRR